MAAVSKRLWSYTSAKNINRSSKGPDQRVKVLKNRKSPQECNKNVIKTTSIQTIYFPFYKIKKFKNLIN
jgi:hypothetical protein